MEDKNGILDLIRRAVEVCRPDLRHYYRMTKKARVVATYASDGKYYCDVQPLRNDESADEREPVVPKVEIPILWAGPRRGVVCPPVVGTFCDLSYYDGDPNYPRISNFRWHDMDAPEAALEEFVIQLEPGVEIRIDRQKHIVALTPENVRTEAGQDIIRKAGKDRTIEAGENISEEAGKDRDIKAGDNISAAAGKNWTALSGDNAEITAGKDVRVTAGANMTLTVTANLAETVTGSALTTVGGLWSITVAGPVKLICPALDLGGEGGLGVVTQECKCMLTGLPHIEGSSVVRAKKNAG
jgi:hypothetical protein